MGDVGRLREIKPLSIIERRVRQQREQNELDEALDGWLTTPDAAAAERLRAAALAYLGRTS